MRYLHTLCMPGCLVLALFLSLSLAACSRYQDEEHEKNVLIGLLMHENYAQLQQELEALDAAYQQKTITPKQWHGRWYALANIGSGGMHERLQKWIEQGGAGRAYLLRAMFLQVRMWRMLEDERDNASAQQAELARQAKLVDADLQQAEQKLPDCRLCLVERITINRVLKKPVAESRQLLERALALDPNLFPALYTYFVNLYPHWNGSYPQMRDFIAEMKRRNIDPLYVAGLESRYCWLQARTASDNGDVDDALEWLQRGVNSQPYDTLIKELADIYLERKEPQNAAQVLEKNLELNNPWDMRTIELLARAYGDAGDKEKANAMIIKRREVVQRYLAFE